MQRQQNEVKHLFPSPIDKNQEPLPMCAVKQENAPVDETCQLPSPTFEPPVKRSLTDSTHDMASHQLKRFKQNKEDQAFWKNKETILLSRKASLQQIVSEVAHSFERNSCVPSGSFEGKETLAFENYNSSSPTPDSMIASPLQRQVFESSPQVAPVTKTVNTNQRNLNASPSSVSSRSKKISMLSVLEQPQAERTMPILRTLKSRGSRVNEGFAIDHKFFPKLVGVHSISPPTAFSPEVEADVDFNQDTVSPPPKKLSQKEATNDFSRVRNTENTANLNYDSEDYSDLVSPISPDENESHAFPLARCSQNLSTDDADKYTREVHVGSKLHVQDRSRALPIIPIALTTHNVPTLPTNMSPALGVRSGPRMNANNLSEREQATRPLQTSTPVSPSLQENLAASSALGQTQHGERERVAVNSTQLFSAPSHVSPTVMYSNKQTPCTSSKNIKSVNMQEVVNIYRMAASGSPRTSQIRNLPAHHRSSLPSEKQYDLLFSFTKPNGKSDLFLVVKDEVFAVERFDYKGESYLIHTNNKGKTSILAKLPEDEKRKLQSATRSQQPTTKGGKYTNETSSGQHMTSQHPAETSLSITALQNSSVRTRSHADTRDTASAISSQRLDSDALHRVLRGENIQVHAKSLKANGVSSGGEAEYDDVRTQGGNNSPTTALKSRRLLLRQVLNGLRTEISNHKQMPPRKTSPQTVSAGQQCFSQAFTDTQVKNQGIYVLSNTHSTPRCADASSNRESNQQFIVNPNLVDRYQENDATNVKSQRQYTRATAQSSVKETRAVSGGRQTASEGIHETLPRGNTLPTSERRTLQRSDLINFLTRQLASNERASSTLTIIDHMDSASRRSEGTKQIFSRPSANGVSDMTSSVATSSRYEELSQNQECRQLRELLSQNHQCRQLRERLIENGGKAHLTQNFVSAASLARQRVVESSRVAQTLTTSSPIPSLLIFPYGVMDRDAESSRKRTSTAAVGQQRSCYVDTTDSFMQEQYCSRITDQQLLNGGNSTLSMRSNQSGNVANLPSMSSGANSTGFLQGIQRPCNNTGTAGEQNVRSRVSDHLLLSTSDSESLISPTSEQRKLFSATDGQRRDTSERPLTQTSKVSKQFDATTPSLEGQPMRAAVSGQRECIEDALERGTTEVIKSYEVAKPLDTEKAAADDDVVEIIDPPPQRDAMHIPNMSLDEDEGRGVNDKHSCVDNEALPESITGMAKPFNCNEHETEDNFELTDPVEEDATNNLNSALRAELEKKIQTTCERIAQEKSDWKKKYLYRLKSELEKKLSKVSGAAEVIVIDDD